jgi:hypothetical protein
LPAIAIASLIIFLVTVYAHAATNVTLDQLKKDGYSCEDVGSNKEQVKCAKIYYCLQSNGFCAPNPID